MPRYAFACPSCGLEFEVSRSMSEAGNPAACPADGTPAERVFVMPSTNFNRPTPPPQPPSPGDRSYSHHGHRHGPGTAGHSH